MSYPQHDRTEAHLGVEEDDTVALSSAIGPYPAGTLLADFLAGLWQQLSSVDANRHVATFTMDAYIARRFTLDAVIRATRSTNFFLDAYIFRGGTGSFTLDARIKRTTTNSFTMSALLVRLA